MGYAILIFIVKLRHPPPDNIPPPTKINISDPPVKTFLKIFNPSQAGEGGGLYKKRYIYKIEG